MSIATIATSTILTPLVLVLVLVMDQLAMVRHDSSLCLRLCWRRSAQIVSVLLQCPDLILDLVIEFTHWLRFDVFSKNSAVWAVALIGEFKPGMFPSML
jgi:hypothetical protein